MAITLPAATAVLPNHPEYVGFEYPLDSDGVRRKVYWHGDGPGVLVMHELPGLAKATVQFAERIVSDGYRVFLPLLFGEAMKETPARNYARLCISAEFARLRANSTAPIT